MARVMKTFFQLPSGARKCDKYIESNKEKKQRTDTKNEAKKIMSDNIGKVYNLIAPKLFGILGEPIIFSDCRVGKEEKGGGLWLEKTVNIMQNQ